MSQLLSGVRRVADFEPLRSLGEGAQGSVYLAQTPARLGLDAAEVAVKVLSRPVQEQEFERAEKELLTAAGARSEYLVPLYEAGHQRDGAIYYVMAYSDQGPLQPATGAQAQARALAAVARAARAAHALHEAGIAHRRIKPSNLLQFEAGVRLSDLDLGHVLTPGQTFGTRIPIPDLQFIDPGLLRGEEAGRSSDVWSLGVTLQVLLGGRPIYPIDPGADLMTAFRTIMGTPPAVDSELDPELAEVVAACVGEKSARPATALELAGRLEALAG